MPKAAEADAASRRVIERNNERPGFQLTNRPKRSRCAGPFQNYPDLFVRMGRLIAAGKSSAFEPRGKFAGSRVVFAVDNSRRMVGLRGRSLPMWTTHFAEPAVHPIKRNGSPDVPAGTSRRVQRRTVILQASGCRANAGGSVKQLAGLEHGMHHHRQLARHGDGRSLEAHSFPKSDAPGP